MFEEQVQKTPLATALIEDGPDDRRMSFAELNARANQVADYLHQKGVCNEAPVAIYMQRSIEQIICLLAILKAGCAYVPIDVSNPEDRIRFILDDADVSIGFAGNALVTPSDQICWIDICQQREEIAQCCPDDANIDQPPEQLLQIIYTSGSSGTPKGVQNTHQGAVNCIDWLQTAYPFEPGEVCCHKTSIGFVDSVMELFTPLSNGISLVLIADHTLREPTALLQTLKTHRVSRIILVPTLLQWLVDRMTSETLPDLSLWLSGGEALPVKLVQQFHEVLENRTLVNIYGSTEVSANLTWYQTSQNDIMVPIGKLVNNARMYLLDKYRQPVPIGAVGTIYAAGICLARGYTRPELNQKSFIHNILGEEYLFETGDMGRYGCGGELEYRGRCDEQISIRGYRVEIREVEAAILSCSDIYETAVVYNDLSGRLLSFVVGSNELIRYELSQKLPSYMIPSLFIEVDELPRLTSGKVGKITFEDAGYLGSDKVVMPANGLEEKMLKIWERVLQVSPISTHDDFFDLGGHSFTSVELFILIEEQCGQKLPTATLFQAPTIKMLCDLMVLQNCDTPLL